MKTFKQFVVEGAVAVSTVEKEIRSNGGSQVKKTDTSIEFIYRGGKRKVPVDRGFVQDKHYMNLQKMFEEVELSEGSESWEAGYERRVVKTTKPEHKEKGYNWRIKGKDRPEISIKLYKEKPSFDEFKKQMKRVAGHEFGG